MAEMGIRNTQYIIVRHHNADNEHLHIVYNRIDNDLKLISVNNDYKRNITVCKKLKDRHGLTYGKGKERVKREKLRNPDAVKYLLYDIIKAILPYCTSEKELQDYLHSKDISVEFKRKRTTGEIEGISFNYDNISLKGSQIDRKFSYGNLKKEFEKNIEAEKIQLKKCRSSRKVSRKCHPSEVLN
ncbi:MAG: relaxase/mobilization nuclease domain-containing protein [Paludibacteraceae bacterium]